MPRRQAGAVEGELAMLAGAPRAAYLVGLVGGAQHPAELRRIAQLREHATASRRRAGQKRIHARQHLGILGQQDDLRIGFLGGLQHGIAVGIQRIKVLLAEADLRIGRAQSCVRAFVVGARNAGHHAGILHRHDGALHGFAARNHKGDRRGRNRCGFARLRAEGRLGVLRGHPGISRHVRGVDRVGSGAFGGHALALLFRDARETIRHIGIVDDAFACISGHGDERTRTVERDVVLLE